MGYFYSKIEEVLIGLLMVGVFVLIVVAVLMINDEEMPVVPATEQTSSTAGITLLAYAKVKVGDHSWEVYEKLGIPASYRWPDPVSEKFPNAGGRWLYFLEIDGIRAVAIIWLENGPDVNDIMVAGKELKFYDDGEELSI